TQNSRLRTTVSLTQMNDSPFEPNSDRLRAAGGAELFKDVLDVDLDRSAGGPQPGGDLLVAQPAGNELQDFGFARRQRFTRKVGVKTAGDVGRDEELACMDRSDRLQHVGVRRFLQQVP